MYKIGAVNIDISHPLAFGNYLSEKGGGMYTAVYNDGFRGDDEVDAFIKKFGLKKRCGSIKELAGAVDIGFVHSCNWDNHLKQAQPFIDAGKPVFIDKPIVGNISDCAKLEKLMSSGALILGSSSVRYAAEVVKFAETPESERGRILHVYGTAGVDEFNYAVHIVEALGTILGQGAESVRFAGKAASEKMLCETYHVSWAGGAAATFSAFSGLWQPFELVIMTTKGTFQFRIDTGKIYAALLDRINAYMETGKNSFASASALTESVKIMLAGRLSRERGGELVRLDSIPAGDPGFDGAAFERDYAATAKKIYLS